MIRAAFDPLISPLGLARSFLAAALVYILFASVFVEVQTTRLARPFAAYYFAVLCVAALLALYSLRGHRLLLKSDKRSQNLLLSGLCLAALAWATYRYPLLLRYSVWFDEATQFFTWGMREDTVLFAAKQQQPPMDYMLSQFARLVFGVSEWSVNIHAVLFSALSLALIPLVMIQNQVSRVWWPPALILFAAQNVLLQASSEGRPVSLAVFFAVLWFIFLRESQLRKVPLKLELIASALGSLYAIGLQPIFFIFLLTLLLAPHFIWYAAALPFLLYLPTLAEIYIESIPYNQFHSGSHVDMWIQSLLGLSTGDFGTFLQTLKPAAWVFVLSPLFAAIFNRKLALQALAFFLLFPILFKILWAAINWDLYERYFVLWPVGAILLTALCWKETFPRRRWAAAFSLLLCVFLHTQYAPRQRAVVEQRRSAFVDWRTMARALPKDQESLIVEIPRGRDQAFQYFAAPVYLSANQQATAWPIEMPERLDFSRVTDLYFLMKGEWPQDPAKSTLRFQKGYYLVHRKPSGPLPQSLAEDIARLHEELR